MASGDQDTLPWQQPTNLRLHLLIQLVLVRLIRLLLADVGFERWAQGFKVFQAQLLVDPLHFGHGVLHEILVPQVADVPWIDLGPLLVFFLAYAMAGIYWATGLLMAATVVALFASWQLLGRLSAVPVALVAVALRTFVWPGRSWLELILAGATIAALYFAIAFFSVLEAEHRQKLLLRFKVGGGQRSAV